MKLLLSTLNEFRRNNINSIFFRSTSAWLTPKNSLNLNKKIDVEALYIKEDVQNLLRNLTGLNTSGKIFTEKKIHSQERSHFALMTDEAYQKTLQKMEDIGKQFLQFVPLKEPRSTKVTILDKDPEIANFDQSKFIFTDITFDATDQDRTIVVREIDGTLRSATPSEHDRMNRLFYEKPNRPVLEPAVFSGDDLMTALNTNKHEFVLDWACWFYEPDDPKYVELSKKIFDEILENKKFDVLYSTRHCGQFLFYCALNKEVEDLLKFYKDNGRIAEAANFIRLYKIIHPNWRTAVSEEDDDAKIVKDFKP
uniref:28S ribosomal protein S22, mitochondrial n=1 Tax=Parastrongyloides trichosuri TaxID=131310 RepID=A0A0N4ZTM9_PARTI